MYVSLRLKIYLFKLIGPLLSSVAGKRPTNPLRSRGPMHLVWHRDPKNTIGRLVGNYRLHCGAGFVPSRAPDPPCQKWWDTSLRSRHSGQTGVSIMATLKSFKSEEWNQIKPWGSSILRKKKGSKCYLVASESVKAILHEAVPELFWNPRKWLGFTRAKVRSPIIWMLERIRSCIVKKISIFFKDLMGWPLNWLPFATLNQNLVFILK